MPYKPMKPCKYPGCPNLTSEMYCEEHSAFNKIKQPCKYPGCPNLTSKTYCYEHSKFYKLIKPRCSARERGYDSRWNKARKAFLSNNPLCAECKKQGRLTQATVVDHIIPHKGNKTLFWDESNWQPLCKICHDRKTVMYDGGFGRKVKVRQECEGD